MFNYWHRFRTWYLESVQGVQEYLLGYSEPSKFPFIGERKGSRFSPKMDHLVCFYPGLLALGTLHGFPLEHLQLAEELLHTCWLMYEKMATGLSPEIVYFNQKPGLGGEDIIVKVCSPVSVLFTFVILIILLLLFVIVCYCCLLLV